MGATATVNLKEQNLEDVMKEQKIIEGFDVGCEMSGNPAALTQMIDHMRNGGKISLLGISSRSEVQLNMNKVIWNGLTMQGIYGRKMYETWYKMMSLVEAGFDLTPVITHRFHYTDFEKGFAAMNSGKSGKVVLSWT